MIKFLDLQKINAQYQNEFYEKMKLVLDKGWFILGDEVKQFETDFAKFTNTKQSGMSWSRSYLLSICLSSFTLSISFLVISASLSASASSFWAFSRH